MKRGIIIMLSCAFALVLGLAGCGGSTGAGAGANPEAGKAAFSGTWDLSSMDDNGEVTSSEDIETLRSLGLDVYLQLDEDGTATLDLFGEQESGTWEAESASSAKMTLEDQAISLTLVDGKLTMEQGDTKLEFTKGEARTAASTASSSSASSEAASDAEDEAEAEAEAEAEGGSEASSSSSSN